MLIGYGCGYGMTISCPTLVSVVMLASVRPERLADLVAPDTTTTMPQTTTTYRNGFGNL